MAMDDLRTVTVRCGKCARTLATPTALGIVTFHDDGTSDVAYVTRQPSTVTVGVGERAERVAASDWGGRTQAPKVRGRTAAFECRSCGAKPRMKRSTLLAMGADALADGQSAIYVSV